MPTIYRVQIQKSLSADSWSNDYIIHEETIEDAQDVASGLIDFEQHIHSTAVFFDYVRISTVLPGDRYFRHIALNQTGILQAVDYLPLYCTARMDMPTADSDPCRKYYRMPVGENYQTSGYLNAEQLGIFNGLITTWLVTPAILGHIFTPRGNPVISASFHPAIQMRQLHRHKRKKVVAP